MEQQLSAPEEVKAAPTPGMDLRAEVHGEELQWLEIQFGEGRGAVTSLLFPAQAQFLATRINSYKGLLEALRDLVAMYSEVAPYGQSPVVEKARAALAKAGEGADRG